MPYHCPFEGCDKQYHRDHGGSFIKHITTSHSGNSGICEKYVCEVCGSAHKSEATLAIHTENIHTGFRGKFSYFCELCGAGFSKNLILKKPQ